MGLISLSRADCGGDDFGVSEEDLQAGFAKGHALDLLHGETLLYIAAVRGYDKKLQEWLPGNMEYLKSHPKVIMHSAGAGRVRSVKALLDAGVDVNTRDDDGATPLMAAVYCRAVGMARFLIERGADINAKSLNQNDAMIVAIVNHDEAMVSLLLGAGFQIAGSRTSSGLSPMDIAIRTRQPRVAELIRAREIAEGGP